MPGDCVGTHFQRCQLLTTLVPSTGSPTTKDRVYGLVAVHQVSNGLLAGGRALVDRVVTARPALNAFGHQRVVLLLLFDSV